MVEIIRASAMECSWSAPEAAKNGRSSEFAERSLTFSASGSVKNISLRSPCDKALFAILFGPAKSMKREAKFYSIRSGKKNIMNFIVNIISLTRHFASV